MSTASFDTLTYAKMLQEAGFTARQAEVQAEALRAVIDENLATKHDIELVRQDLKEMESRTEVRLKELDAKIELLRRDMKELDARQEVRLKEMETRLLLKMELMRRDTIIWLGGMIVVATSTLGLLMKVL